MKLTLAVSAITLAAVPLAKATTAVPTNDALASLLAAVMAGPGCQAPTSTSSSLIYTAPTNSASVGGVISSSISSVSAASTPCTTGSSSASVAPASSSTSTPAPSVSVSTPSPSASVAGVVQSAPSNGYAAPSSTAKPYTATPSASVAAAAASSPVSPPKVSGEDCDDDASSTTKPAITSGTVADAISTTKPTSTSTNYTPPMGGSLQTHLSESELNNVSGHVNGALNVNIVSSLAGACLLVVSYLVL